MGGCTKIKTRHGNKQNVLHGEADSVDRAQLAVNRMELIEMIGQYSLRYLFSFDESALFYRLTPNMTMATVKCNERSQRRIVSQSQCAET